jgi:hypothetical protein
VHHIDLIIVSGARTARQLSLADVDNKSIGWMIGRERRRERVAASFPMELGKLVSAVAIMAGLLPNWCAVRASLLLDPSRVAQRTQRGTRTGTGRGSRESSLANPTQRNRSFGYPPRKRKWNKDRIEMVALAAPETGAEVMLPRQRSVPRTRAAAAPKAEK